MGFNTIKVNNTDTNYTHSIFDISEYNSGTIYANLSAALSAVPQEKQKGGMSVKFILTISQAQYSVVKTEGLETEPSGTLLSEEPYIDSGTYAESQLSTIFSTLPSAIGASHAETYYVAVAVDETTTYTSWVITKVQNTENKYVQYRLMSNEWSITLEDWQGVDERPIARSKNLVESGGIFVYTDITSSPIQINKCAIGNVGQQPGFSPLNGCNVTKIIKTNSTISIDGIFPSVSRHLEFVNDSGVITRIASLTDGVHIINFENNEASVYVNAEDGLKVYSLKGITDINNDIIDINNDINDINNVITNIDNDINDKLPIFFVENIDPESLTYRTGYINRSGQFTALAETSKFKVLELDVKAGDYLMVRSIRGVVCPALIWVSDGESGYIKVKDDTVVGSAIPSIGNMCITFIKVENDAHYFISGNIGFPFEILKFDLSSLNDNSIYKKVKNLENDVEDIENIIVKDASDILYIAFGDSITQGIGATDFYGYPNKLNEYFNFGTFSNRGISATSFCKQDNANGIIYTKTHELSSFQGIITVAGGTNDFGNLHSPLGSFDNIKNVSFANLIPPSTTYSENYTFAEAFRYTIEDLQRNNPNAKIVVLIPINRYNATTDYGYGDLDSYREMEIKICKLLGIEYVDMSQCGIPSFNSSVYFRLNGGSPDGLHPNDFGYELMTSFLIPRFNNYIIEVRYINT